jgi:site-specific DNA recombinase
MAKRRARRTVEASAVTRVIGYVRVSTDKQADSGLSIDAQRARLEAWCVMQGAELLRVEVDAGASAKTLDRPGLGRALASIDAGDADALLVAKLDRLTRSVRDLDALLSDHFADGAGDLVSVAESIDTRSAAGRLVLNVLASVAQWEREAIGERTAAALAVKAGRGERVGAVPYGYELASDGVRLVAVVSEQEAIAVARGLRDQGRSLRAIASDLAARGHVARSGKPFAAMQVSRMLEERAPEAA